MPDVLTCPRCKRKLSLVLAGLIVAGAFGLFFAGLGVRPGDTGAVLLLGGAVLVPVVLGSLILYATGASRSFARMGPVAGTILLTILLGGLVIVSAVIVFFAVCFYAITSH
jgi:hypothetical protein